MHIRQPAIRQKASNGAYYVRWGGKDHYLSRDPTIAHQLFHSPTSDHPASLARWKAWAKARLSAKTTAPPPPPAPATSKPTPTTTPTLTIARAAAQLDEHYTALGRPDAAAYYRKHLRRFLHVHGLASLLAMTTPDPKRHRFKPPIVPFLQAFVDDLRQAGPPEIPKPISPKTINHDVLAVKRLINFMASRGHCPEVNWRGVSKLPTRRGSPEPIPRSHIRTLFNACRATDPRIVPYFAACYLACCRPSEAIRLVHADGLFEPIQHKRQTIPRALFRPRVHKNSWRSTGEDYGRAIILTEEALYWIFEWPAAHLSASSQSVQPWSPPWSRLDSLYAASVRAGLSTGPHVLRDSCSSHLREQGMPLADVRTCLGHLPTGEWQSYAQVPWPQLRAALARLTLR